MYRRSPHGDHRCPHPAARHARLRRHAIDKLHLPALLQTGGPAPPTGSGSAGAARAAAGVGPGALAVLVWSTRLALDQHAARLHRRRQRSRPTSPPDRPTTCWLRGSARVQRPADHRRRDSRPADGPAIDHLQQALTAHRQRDCLRRPGEFNDRSGAVIVVYPTTSPQVRKTGTLVQPLSNDVIPRRSPERASTRRWAGRRPLDRRDQFLGHRLFVFFGAVMVLRFLLLMVVFRSVVLPLKAVIMNLSASAPPSASWWRCSSGAGRADHRHRREGADHPWIPVVLFAMLFGLSMDYEVFLLSRIREEWLRTNDNSLAVADGLAVTGSDHHRGGGHHVLRLCLVRVQGPAAISKVFGLGLAPPSSLTPRRADDARPGDHGAARARQLVDASLDGSVDPRIGLEVTPSSPIPSPA